MEEHWRVWAEGGLAFVGGNTGREVCVQGTTAGSAALKIRMREGERDVRKKAVPRWSRSRRRSARLM